MTELYEPKAYPLEVERTTEGETYYSKGWQDAREFAEAVITYAFEDTGAFIDFSPDDVRYEVWRCIPADPYDGCYVWFIPGQLGSPGAFPVTIIYS